MYGHPDAVRQSVRMAIHFFVNFEVFESLYLSKNLPDKHQTWGLWLRLVPSPSRFENMQWVRRLSSPRPNPESSLGFSLRYSAGAYRRKSQHFKTSLPVTVVWLSVYSKIHESSKSKVKPQIKVVIVQQTIFTSRASQFWARPFIKSMRFRRLHDLETVSF